MKKNIIIIILLSVAAAPVLRAQQMPLSSSTYFMRLLYNPALTGYNGSSNAYGYFRDQWTGMPGHPVTMGGMGEVSLWKEQSNVGFHVYNDVTSIIRNVGAQAYYAQKIHLAKDHDLSIGLSLGILNTHIDYNSAVQADPNDPNILTANKAGIGFDMNAGISYHWRKKLTIGFAVPHIAQTNVLLADQTKRSGYEALRHYIVHVSYELSFKNEKWNIEPSIMFKKGNVKQLYQFDGNVTANYNRFLYLGIGYRQDYGMSFLGGVRIARCVTLAYTYELPVASATSYVNTKGTHEVLLGINFDKWIKNADRVNKRMDAVDQKVDATMATDSSLLRKIDSINQTNKQLIRDNEEAKVVRRQHEARIKTLEDKVDSLEAEAADYKKRVASKPAGYFSSMDAGQKEKIKQGDVIRLDQVYFENNSSVLKAESYAQLDKLAEMMKASPSMTVKVLGHTDDKDSEAYNQWLSERRARRVADYLGSKGIAPARMSAIGYGKRLPIADNTTEQGRALNRRVEIDIVKK